MSQDPRLCSHPISHAKTGEMVASYTQIYRLAASGCPLEGLPFGWKPGLVTEAEFDLHPCFEVVALVRPRRRPWVCATQPVSRVELSEPTVLGVN